MKYKSINRENILKTGVLLSALSVIIGAFGTHSLESILVENQRVDTYDTAVLYQIFHSVAIIVCGILYESYDKPKLRISFYLFLIGVLLFSGSLYVLSITNLTILGAITPFGGLSFIVGWIYFFLSIKK